MSAESVTRRGFLRCSVPLMGRFNCPLRPHLLSSIMNSHFRDMKGIVRSRPRSNPFSNWQQIRARAKGCCGGDCSVPQLSSLNPPAAPAQE